MPTRYAVYDDNGSPYTERYGPYYKTRAEANRKKRRLEATDVAGRHVFAVHKVPNPQRRLLRRKTRNPYGFFGEW